MKNLLLATTMLLSPTTVRAFSVNSPLDRREASTGIAIVVGSTTAITCPIEPAVADAGEAIRRGAANMPGYGPSDIFYPESLKGKWKAVREIAGDKTIEYELRFILSAESNAVVADRGYNQAALERALSSSNPVRTYEWTKTNPNDLRLSFEDGSKKEIKVTKRASERTEDTLSSSEVQRITTEDYSRRVPIISAQRTLTKWKIMSDSVVEGLELVYDLGGGDPLAGATVASGPQAVSKSRLHLERIIQ